MTLQEAERIVGRANACEPFLSNMIKALSLCPWLNSEEDARRLQAARMVKAAKGQKMTKEGAARDVRLVHQESVSYQTGYNQAFNGLPFRCPCMGNALAERDHAWGYEHGKTDRAKTLGV